LKSGTFYSASYIRRTQDQKCLWQLIGMS